MCLLIFFILILFVILLTIKKNFIQTQLIEGMGSTATECRQSVEDIQKAFDAQKKEDQARYDTAMQTWQAKKNAIVSNFQNNPAAWPSLCVNNANLCEPVTDFFQRYDNANLSGWGREETGGNSWEKCLSKCRDRTDCQWVNWTTGGTCFINTLGDRNGSEHGFKTDRGYARYSNQYIDGYTIRGIDNTSPEQCQSYCDQDPGCHHWQVGSDRKCYLQNTGNAGNMRVGVKKPSVGISIPDYHPLIVNQIGAPPKLERTQVPIQNIICQDCSQQINNTSVSDSKDVNFTQINQCIANMEAKEAAAKDTPNTTKEPVAANSQIEQSNTTTTTNTTPTTTPTPTTKDSSEATPPSSQSALTFSPNVSTRAIIGGVVSCIICVIIIIAIIFLMRKRGEDV